MDKRIRSLALGGVFCALTLLLTLLSVPLPSSLGYINAGDVGVFLCATVLPLPFAALAAAIGAALADVILGYAIYAPATLLIKGAAALAAALLLKRFSGRLRIIALLVGALAIPLGYLGYELLLGYGAAALANVPLNALQACAGAGLAYAIGFALPKLGVGEDGRPKA